MNSLAHSLDLLADAINPLLVLALIVAPLLVCRRAGEPLPWSFWLRSALAIALVYLVAHFDRRWHIWASWGSDYSTHSALALAAALSLACFRRHWLNFLLPLLLLYGALMLVLGYHTVTDMLTTALLVVPLTLLCHRVRSTRPVEATA